MNAYSLKKLFLYTLIGSVAVSAIVGIGVVVFGDFGGFEVRVLMTTLTVTVTSILGLACGAYLETGRGRTLPIIGILLAIVSAVMSFFIIWNVLDDSETFIKTFVTASLMTAACSHLSLLMLAKLDRRFRWAPAAAFVSVGTLTAVLILITWFQPDESSELMARIIGVLGILVGSITVITPVLHKLSSTGTVQAIDAEIEKLKARLAELETERSGLVDSADA